jgi:hypothetical protein
MKVDCGIDFMGWIAVTHQRGTNAFGDVRRVDVHQFDLALEVVSRVEDIMFLDAVVGETPTQIARPSPAGKDQNRWRYVFTAQGMTANHLPGLGDGILEAVFRVFVSNRASNGAENTAPNMRVKFSTN